MGFIRGRFVAVKQIPEQLKKAYVENEIEILSRLKHKNIVQYFGCLCEKETLNIYLEYMDGKAQY